MHFIVINLSLTDNFTFDDVQFLTYVQKNYVQSG